MLRLLYGRNSGPVWSDARAWAAAVQWASTRLGVPRPRVAARAGRAGAAPARGCEAERARSKHHVCESALCRPLERARERAAMRLDVRRAGPRGGRARPTRWARRRPRGGAREARARLDAAALRKVQLLTRERGVRRVRSERVSIRPASADERDVRGGAQTDLVALSVVTVWPR